MTKYTIEETDVNKENGYIAYKAIHGERGAIRGTISNHVGFDSYLDDDGLEDLADSLIGNEIQAAPNAGTVS